MRDVRLVVIVGVLLMSTACGALGIAQLATITSSFADGVGDTAAGAPATVYDITKVVSRRIDSLPFGSYDTIEVELTFNQIVVLPAAGTGPGVSGAQLAFDLGFNTDLDTTTGFILGCGSLGTWTGLDFAVLAEGGGAPGDRLPNGNFNVINPALTTTGQATVSVSGNVLTVSTPLSAIGGDDGQTHLSVFAGNRNGGLLNVTDCAPDPTGAVVTSPRGTPRTGLGR